MKSQVFYGITSCRIAKVPTFETNLLLESTSLKTEVVPSSETSVTIYKAAPR
jgi:hypothetical protein